MGRVGPRSRTGGKAGLPGPRARCRTRVAQPRAGHQQASRGERARPRHRQRRAGSAREPVRAPDHRHRHVPESVTAGGGDVRAQRARRRTAAGRVVRARGPTPLRSDRVQPAVRGGTAPRGLRVPRLGPGRGRCERAARAAVARVPHRGRHRPPAGLLAAPARRGLGGPGAPVAAAGYGRVVRATGRRRSLTVRGHVAARHGHRPSLRRGEGEGCGLAGLVRRERRGGHRLRVRDPASHGDHGPHGGVRGFASRLRRPARGGGRGLARPGRLAACPRVRPAGRRLSRAGQRRAGTHRGARRGRLGHHRAPVASH